MRGLCRGRGDLAAVRLHHLDMADGANRGAVTGAHAGGAHYAHAGTKLLRQIRKQVLGAGKRAGQRIADAHRDRRRRRLALLHDIEMGIEGRDLVDLGQRELHLVRQRRKMRGGQMTVVILDEMQMLDQQVAPARPVGQKREHFLARRRIDLTALRGARRPAAARPSGLPGRSSRRLLGQAHNILANGKKRASTGAKQAPNAYW